MDWKRQIVNAQQRIDEAEYNAKETVKTFFPIGTKFDLGNHRYKVIDHAFNQHRNFGVDIKNVKNFSTRPIDILNEMERIENISLPDGE